MNITYCERCGKNKNEQRGNEAWITLDAYKQHSDGKGQPTGSYDLCPECWRAVHGMFDARIKPARPYLHDTCSRTMAEHVIAEAGRCD